MSSNGVYSYWPKVNNPNQQFVQMNSGGYQPPFYFGGSQVPANLSGRGITQGKSIDTQYRVRPIYKDEWGNETRIKPTYTSGKGLDQNVLSLADHGDKIYIPKHLTSLHK